MSEVTDPSTSKKAAKKLAKKVENAAKKQSKKSGGAPPVEPKAKAKATTDGPSPDKSAISEKPLHHYLLHGSESCLATLKASVASSVFGIKLSVASGADSGKLSYFQKPVLITSHGDAAVFGGNGICKALGLISGSVSVGRSMEVDDWLEFERSNLRVCGGSKWKAGLDKLEKALSDGKNFLVGDSISAADISIVLTIHQHLSTDPSLSLSPIMASYVNGHIRSSKFEMGANSKSKLIPAAAISYTSHPSQLRAVESIFHTAILDLFPYLEIPPKSVATCNNPKHGDYQCNSAMKFFKQIKANDPSISSPQSLARAIIDKIPPSNPVIASLTVNGPGFILCKIKPSYLQPHIDTLLKNRAPPPPAGLTPTTCVVDFSSPNIAKEMHVGHLRSTIIGEAVCRILEFVENDVKRVNHVGDWGTQFGMLIQFLKEEFPSVAEGNAEGVSITDLTQFYKKAKQRFDADPVFKKVSQQNVVALQSGCPLCLSIWKMLCDISRGEFQKVYNRLDITLEECGESFYNDKIQPVIAEYQEKSLISVEEGGAKCVFVPKYKVPLMLQKSDGGFGYDSTDMAALKYRLQTLNAKQLIYITDFSQGDHFSMCFSAAELAGWITPADGIKLTHIGFGTVQGEDGKRFKTRSGDTVRLVDLLDEAKKRMYESLEVRIKEGKANITMEELDKVSSTLGYSAVKYFDLRRNPTTNYKFSYDQMLDTRGNTAIYLLYAHARLESICTKGKKLHAIDVDELIKTDPKVNLLHPSEVNLALYLNMFADTVENTLEDLYPYHVCEYLYNTSNAASEFVTQCKVLGSPEMETRLLMCRATTLVMRKCFDLLGIRYVMRI